MYQYRIRFIGKILPKKVEQIQQRVNEAVFLQPNTLLGTFFKTMPFGVFRFKGSIGRSDIRSAQNLKRTTGTC